MEVRLTGALPAPIDRAPLALGLLSDERLARLVGAGNQRAFATVYERYHQQLYRYCRSILRQEADAQDALQSTLAGAFSALERGQCNAPLRPWLFRIAHNESVSLLRRRRAQLELPERSERTTRSVEEWAEERERLSLLVSDLLELPERQRSALVMRELSGLSHEEIAIALDTSVGAAKQTIFEARRSLFEYAEGRAMPCEDVRRMISDADGRSLRGRGVRAHLRDCAGCAAFADAIPARKAELHALAPPLGTAAVTALLTRMLGRGVSNGGGTPSVAAAAAGKTVGTGLAAKALAGLVVAAATTVGVTTAVEHATGSHRPVAAASTHRSAAPSALGRRYSAGRRLSAHQKPLGLRATSRSAMASSTRRPGVASNTSARSQGASSNSLLFSSSRSKGTHAPGQAASPSSRATAHVSPGRSGAAPRGTGRSVAGGLGKGSGGLGKGSLGPAEGSSGLAKGSGR